VKLSFIYVPAPDERDDAPGGERMWVKVADKRGPYFTDTVLRTVAVVCQIATLQCKRLGTAADLLKCGREPQEGALRFNASADPTSLEPT
jgi:hypothetical protein